MKLDNLKGTHPGIVLERELKKRSLKLIKFAATLNEPPKKLAAIINGSQPFHTALSLKIEKYLSKEEGYFMILQVYYDILQEKNKNTGMSKDSKNIDSTGKTDLKEINKKLLLKCIGAKKEIYLKKLDLFFNEQKLFLKNNLTIEDVSKKNRIPQHHLSSIINSEFNMSFTNYVNLKRMQYFIESLEDIRCEHLSLETLALRSGFKSRTTCFRFFIKQTGCSPSQYIKKSYPEAVKKRGYIRKVKY